MEEPKKNPKQQAKLFIQEIMKQGLLSGINWYMRVPNTELKEQRPLFMSA